MKDHQMVSYEPTPTRNETILRDEDHPRSVINLVPPTLREKILALPAELVDIGESELRLAFHEAKHVIGVMDDRLRFMFWREYDVAQSYVRDMNLTHVYYGICSRETFYKRLKSKWSTAWIMCPPVDYLIGAEEALTYGLEQLRDVLAQPHTSILGVVDARAAAVKLEIVKMLDARIKGAIVQTTKNLNVNVNANKPMAPAPRIEDVDVRIKELEDQIKNMNEGVKRIVLEDVIDVTPEVLPGG